MLGPQQTRAVGSKEGLQHGQVKRPPSPQIVRAQCPSTTIWSKLLVHGTENKGEKSDSDLSKVTQQETSYTRTKTHL